MQFFNENGFFFLVRYGVGLEDVGEVTGSVPRFEQFDGVPSVLDHQLNEFMRSFHESFALLLCILKHEPNLLRRDFVCFRESLTGLATLKRLSRVLVAV